MPFLSADELSFRTVANGERNGQTNEEPVLDKLANLIDQRHVSFGHRGERQDEPMHNQIDQRAIKDSRKTGRSTRNSIRRLARQ